MLDVIYIKIVIGENIPIFGNCGVPRKMMIDPSFVLKKTFLKMAIF